MPFDQIAKDFGRTSGAIKQRAALLGLIEQPCESHHRPWSPDDEMKLSSMIAQGMPFSEIATALGRTLRSIDTRASVIDLKRKVVDPSSVLRPQFRLHTGDGEAVTIEQPLARFADEG